jgi:phage terminase small subunit
MSLAFRQRRFVNEYLVKLNAAKAAIRAGYSPKTAKSQGSRLLTNVDVN